MDAQAYLETVRALLPDIAARAADELFPWLDGPVRRVASLDSWVAYAPQLEAEILPGVGDVLQAIRELARY